jgi:hypothetical protein
MSMTAVRGERLVVDDNVIHAEHRFRDARERQLPKKGMTGLGKLALAAVVGASVAITVGAVYKNGQDNLNNCHDVAVTVGDGQGAAQLVDNENDTNLGPNQWQDAVDYVQKQGKGRDKRGHHVLEFQQGVNVPDCDPVEAAVSTS